MTLSNFDWTDKDSVKWFILLPTGHEGPYSLKNLEQMRLQKKIAANVKIWTEGLAEPILLKTALETPTMSDEDEIPDLPPIPDEDVPFISSEVDVETSTKKSISVPAWAFISVVVLIMLYFAFSSVVRNDEKITINRLPKMTHKLHERITQENVFDGWDKKIFFREYLPDDHGHIWLVSSGFQHCDVEASFQSIQDKMLSYGDDKVSFKTNGKLSHHIVEFSSFDFLAGNKIIPGLYEMDVRATNCEWEGFIPLFMNGFSSPDQEYVARTKVILFSKGAEEFNKILDKIIRKKLELSVKEMNQNELFWQDLQQKLETLQAIALQIEQLLLDYLDESPKTFTRNLKTMVEKYTRQFGSFLTSFVVENEDYFLNLNPEAKGISQKRNYELMVRMTSKKIGLESMKFIEEFQALKKNPTQIELNKYSERVREIFSSIKTDINQKIIQVSEDRSK